MKRITTTSHHQRGLASIFHIALDHILLLLKLIVNKKKLV